MVRVLLTVKPRMYREALALAVQRNRPDAEAMLVSADVLDGQMDGFEPHMLVRNDTDGEIPSGFRDRSRTSCRPSERGWLVLGLRPAVENGVRSDSKEVCARHEVGMSFARVDGREVRPKRRCVRMKVLIGVDPHSRRRSPSPLSTNPILAARIIGTVGSVARSPTKAHFASYSGTAPVEASSGEVMRHRLSLALKP